MVDLNPPHALQVTRTALRLYELTTSLHQLDTTAKLYLATASLLHDCGKVIAKKDHHLTSQTLIMNVPGLPFTPRERKLIGMIARYHRAAYPHSEDRYFRNVGLEKQKCVETLSALLRLADGLCRVGSALQDVDGEIGSSRITLNLHGVREFDSDREFQRKKMHYFELIFNKAVKLSPLPEAHALPTVEWSDLLAPGNGTQNLTVPSVKPTRIPFPVEMPDLSEQAGLLSRRHLTTQRRRRLTG